VAATTVDAVKLLLAGMLGYADDTNGTADPTKLSSFWTPIIAESVADAEAWLRHTLTKEMGFPATEVADWPMFNHYHKRLSVWMAGAYRAGELSIETKTALERFDCRAEIRALTTLGGTADEESRVGVGLLERDDDLFRRPSVNANGTMPADIFNTRRAWTGRDCWR
jgi:hypothetical protein